MPKRNTVYVIGAGFSAGLGYPLTSDLLVRLWGRLNDPLKSSLLNVIDFHHPGFDPNRFTSFPNIEQLLSEMVVNEELFDASRHYEGGFTKANLQGLQKNLLLEVTDWFHDLSPVAQLTDPRLSWLLAFRDRVQHEAAAIISFNWDLVLDEILFGTSIGSSSYGFIETSGSVTLLKPHGSLNWFEENVGNHLSSRSRSLIFGEAGKGAIYCFNEFRAPISKVNRDYPPLIVPPIYLKDFERPVLRAIWNSCTAALSTASDVIFLGYSMPAADIHAQFILRCGFYNQKHGKPIEPGKRTEPTGPAVVTIVNPDHGAATRIAAVVGPESKCKWVSSPVADWIAHDTRATLVTTNK